MGKQCVAGFIDVGFLRAVVAAAVGTDASRVRLDAAGVASLVASIADDMHATVLRSYWYDGQHAVEDPRYASQKRYFDAVAATPGIQLRLGTLAARTPAWQAELVRALGHFGITKEQFSRHFSFQPELTQKGVDTLLVLDMVRLANRHSYDVAVIISGDRDVVEAARIAGELGRRIVLVVPPEERSVAAELRHVADKIVRLTGEQLCALDRARSADEHAPSRQAHARSGPPTSMAAASNALVPVPALLGRGGARPSVEKGAHI